MKKTLRKLVLDRETIMPLTPEALEGVAGGNALPQPGGGPSVGIICSNCVSAPTTRPPNPRPSLPGGTVISAITGGPIGGPIDRTIGGTVRTFK